MSEYIAKASIEPRDYRVVFLIQKRPINTAYTMFIGLFFLLYDFTLINLRCKA